MMAPEDLSPARYTLALCHTWKNLHKRIGKLKTLLRCKKPLFIAVLNEPKTLSYIVFNWNLFRNYCFTENKEPYNSVLRKIWRVFCPALSLKWFQSIVTAFTLVFLKFPPRLSAKLSQAMHQFKCHYRDIILPIKTYSAISCYYSGGKERQNSYFAMISGAFFSMNLVWKISSKAFLKLI